MTKIVGILNITPDSFSDGGKFNNSLNCSEQLLKLLQDGADVIDIGAISTRPNATILTPEEEIKRYQEVLPTIAPILNSAKVEISIDSFHFETIDFLSKQLPISWINDQSGLKNPELIKIAKNKNLKLLVMHQLGLPANPHMIIPENKNTIKVIKNWLEEKINFLLENGLRQEQIIIDPGIGFGKTSKQSWEVIKAAKEFVSMRYSILFGHSRKSFLSSITDATFSERDFETSIISYHLATCEINYLRVHDVSLSKRMLKVYSKIWNK